MRWFKFWWFIADALVSVAVGVQCVVYAIGQDFKGAFFSMILLGYLVANGIAIRTKEE